jgi:hypothetical protein
MVAEFWSILVSFDQFVRSSEPKLVWPNYAGAGLARPAVAALCNGVERAHRERCSRAGDFSITASQLSKTGTRFPSGAHAPSRGLYTSTYTGQACWKISALIFFCTQPVDGQTLRETASQGHFGVHEFHEEASGRRLNRPAAKSSSLCPKAYKSVIPVFGFVQHRLRDPAARLIHPGLIIFRTIAAASRRLTGPRPPSSGQKLLESFRQPKSRRDSPSHHRQSVSVVCSSPAFLEIGLNRR